MRLQYQPPEDWRDFERLCKVIFAKKFQIQELSLYGRQGSKQNGVDLFGRYRHWYSALGVQCKLKQNYPMKCITVKEVADEINKAKEFKPELSHYIVATTAPRNIQVQDYLHNEVASDDTLRFSVDVCFWDDIQDYLNDFPDVANRFYNNKENSELFFLEPFYKSIGLNDESDVFYYYESDQGEIYLTGKHDDLTIYVKKDSIFINFNKECRFNLRMVNGCTKKIGHIYIDIFSLTDFLGGFVHGELISSYSVSVSNDNVECEYVTSYARVNSVYEIKDNKVFDDCGYSIPEKDAERLSSIYKCVKEIKQYICNKDNVIR